MTIHTVKLSEINTPENNPRKSFHKDTIEGLADSIKKDGLLQNLVVAPMKGKKYRIISGERRYRALQLLLANGEITSDYEVSVEVRKNLSKHDKLRIATVENVQREKLAPMDEAEAFTSLAQEGVSLADLAAQTGFAVKTIKRRLALSSLCFEAKQALRDNLITLSIAEALTIGSDDDQRAMLEQRGGYNFNADDIRDHLIDRKPSVSLAIFSLEDYQGTFTKDLFADEDSTYFDDEEQFLFLQGQAVNQCAEQYKEKGAGFVEITEGYSLPEWHYTVAEDGVQDTTVRVDKAEEKNTSADGGAKKREKVYERYTFSLTTMVSSDIDSISFMPSDFRANRSDVIKAGVGLLKSMPKSEVIKLLREVK